MGCEGELAHDKGYYHSCIAAGTIDRFRRPTTEAICGDMSSKISEKDSLATKEDLAEFRIALAELRSDMHQAVRESTKWSC